METAEYFTEEVRRQLGKLYGEAELYGGGLSVRTTLDPKLQEFARKALMHGLVSYDHSYGFRGPVASGTIAAVPVRGRTPRVAVPLALAAVTTARKRCSTLAASVCSVA